MSETGHEPESFPDRIIFASMFNDKINWENPVVQATCLSHTSRKHEREDHQMNKQAGQTKVQGSTAKQVWIRFG